MWQQINLGFSPHFLVHDKRPLSRSQTRSVLVLVLAGSLGCQGIDDGDGSPETSVPTPTPSPHTHTPLPLFALRPPHASNPHPHPHPSPTPHTPHTPPTSVCAAPAPRLRAETLAGVAHTQRAVDKRFHLGEVWVRERPRERCGQTLPPPRRSWHRWGEMGEVGAGREWVASVRSDVTSLTGAYTFSPRR